MCLQIEQSITVEGGGGEGGPEVKEEEEGAEQGGEGMEVDGEAAPEGKDAAAEGEAAQPEEAEEQPAQPTRSREPRSVLHSPVLPVARCLSLCLPSPASIHHRLLCWLPPTHPYTAAAEVGFDGTLEELQALVASLAMAVAFSKALTACMTTITQVGRAPCCWLRAVLAAGLGCVGLSGRRHSHSPACPPLTPSLPSLLLPAAAGLLHRHRCAGVDCHAAHLQAV